MFTILLYHGTIELFADDILNNGIDLNKSNLYLHFGPGFYTTPSKNFAVNTAKNRLKRFTRFNRDRQSYPNQRCALVLLNYDQELAASLNVKTFDETDDKWAQFVIANRLTDDTFRVGVDHNFDLRYDIVQGATADGKNNAINISIDLVQSNKLKLNAIDPLLIAPTNTSSWGEQFSFHSPAALSCIKVKEVLYY